MLKNWFNTKTDNDVGDERHFNARIISSTSTYLPSGPSDIKDILYASCSGFGFCKTLININGKSAFLLWTQEVSDSTTWTFDEAYIQVERHLRERKIEPLIVLCNFEESGDEKPARKRSFMISVLSLKAETAQSITTSYHDRLAFEEDNHKSTGRHIAEKRVFNKHKLTVTIISLTLILMVALLSAAYYHYQITSTTHLWMSWAIPTNSKGLQNQLQFTWPHPSFTNWTAETGRSVNDFSLRLDDQALVPPECIDEYDLQYQEWYTKRYPLYTKIASTKAYLNESYWRETSNFPVEIDYDFHIAHCVLALKRYWKARESNRHVCPRDVEHGHIGHCFGVLESYAFEGFETKHRMDPLVNGTSLVWIVNACF